MKQIAWLLRKRVLVVLCSVWLTCIASPVAAQEPVELHAVPATEQFTGNISTFDQDVDIAGTVSGDVTSWNGAIRVSGTVNGDVVSYAGNITITPTGRVNGNVMALDGGLQSQAGAQISGQQIGSVGGSGALNSVFELFTPGPSTTSPVVDSISQALFGLVTGIFVLAFCLIVAALWPQRTATAALTLRELPLRSIALGLLTTLILGLLLLPVAAVLSATLLGLPLLALLLVLLHVPYIYGIAALVQTFNLKRSSPSTIGPSRSAILAGCVLAVTIGVATALLPLGGLALFYLVASPGLGAAIFSRGGLLLPRAL